MTRYHIQGLKTFIKCPYAFSRIILLKAILLSRPLVFKNRLKQTKLLLLKGWLGKERTIYVRINLSGFSKIRRERLEKIERHAINMKRRKEYIERFEYKVSG